MTGRPYLSMIQRSVEAEGITFEAITPDYVYRVSCGGQSFVMVDAETGLNNSASAMLALSKSLTYDVLHAAGVPAVEHRYLANPNSRFSRSDDYQVAESCFRSFGQQVVLKQDDGAQGRHVYRIHTLAELTNTLDSLFALQLNAAVGPYYEAELEYRIVTFNHEARVILGKRRGASWKHNLINGAVAVVIEDEAKHKALAELAAQASRAMGLAFCSIDILETGQGLLVIEVNPKVMLDEYCKQNPQRIPELAALYREVLLQRFGQLGGL
ncbi:ATP-grasp domain-containing protein [Paenibacillus donghaensis]|uniref:ATP-grasp domain-containing protein n=1 Tax=Paenibacillus donghaensis TaxID=414771 RepID=A0A2Z2KXX6_9BACL|nr:hypothetical protein [Paenibacillus donghaensis]ASA25188.1 hypothetical protein B9T62_33330 [Paenibacillus donghaensis]